MRGAFGSSRSRTCSVFRVDTYYTGTRANRGAERNVLCCETSNLNNSRSIKSSIMSPIRHTSNRRDDAVTDPRYAFAFSTHKNAQKRESSAKRKRWCLVGQLGVLAVN